MDSTLWAAVVTGVVAAIAILASIQTTRLTLAHQRDLSYADRHWRAVTDLYVDILLQEKDYGELIAHTMSAKEGSAYMETQRDRVAAWKLLHARVDVFASDDVRELFTAWRDAYARYTIAILQDRQRHEMVDFARIPAGDVTAEPHRIAYWAAGASLRERIRSEMNDLRRIDPAGRYQSKCPADAAEVSTQPSWPTSGVGCYAVSRDGRCRGTKLLKGHGPT